MRRYPSSQSSPRAWAPYMSAARSSRPPSSCWPTSSTSTPPQSLVVESIGFLPAEVEPNTIGQLSRARVYVGFAGWGPGQLDAELEEGSWIVEPALPEDVFTDDPDGLWSGVLRRKGGPFGLLAAMPPDPSRN